MSQRLQQVCLRSSPNRDPVAVGDQVAAEGRLHWWVGAAVEVECRLWVVKAAEEEHLNWVEAVLSAHSSVEEVVERALKWVGGEEAQEHSSVVKAVERALR